MVNHQINKGRTQGDMLYNRIGIDRKTLPFYELAVEWKKAVDSISKLKNKRTDSNPTQVMINDAVDKWRLGEYEKKFHGGEIALHERMKSKE